MIYPLRLKARLRRFRSESNGWVALELLTMLPLLFWTILAPLQYFDAFRAELISTKATLTVADMYSRETGYIDSNYLNGTRQLLSHLSQAEVNPSFRVTLLTWNNSQNKYLVVWSRKRGTNPTHTKTTLNLMSDELPLLANGERAILVESWTTYEPNIKFGSGMSVMKAAGLRPLEFHSSLVTSPRFATTVCWNNTPSDPSKEKC